MIANQISTRKSGTGLAKAHSHHGVAASSQLVVNTLYADGLHVLFCPFGWSLDPEQHQEAAVRGCCSCRPLRCQDDFILPVT